MHVLLPSETMDYVVQLYSFLYFILLADWKTILYYFSGLATLGVDVSIVSTGGINVKHEQGMIMSQTESHITIGEIMYQISFLTLKNASYIQCKNFHPIQSKYFHPP